MTMAIGKRKSGVGAVLLVGLLAGFWFVGNPLRQCLQVTFAIRAAQNDLDGLRFSDALKRLERVESLATNNAGLQYLLGVAHRRADNLTAVEKHLRRAAQLGWPADDIKRQRMMTAFQSGDFASSEAYLSQLMTQGASDPVALEVYECLAKGRMAAYRLHDALVCLDHWIQWRPTDVQPLYWRAAIWNAVDHSLREEADLKHILEIEPDHLEARFRYGECLMRLNKTSEAIAQVRRCHERAPNDLNYTLLLARCCLRAGNEDEARRLLSEELSPQGEPHLRSLTLSLLAQIELDDDNYERAIDLLLRSIELDTDAANAHYLLGRALARVGKRAEAEKHFERSDAINKSGSRLHDLGRTMINHPHDSELKIETAEALIEHDMPEDALPVVLSIVRSGHGGARAERALAAIYELQGRDDLARRHRDAAQQLGGAVSQVSEPPLESDGAVP